MESKKLIAKFFDILNKCGLEKWITVGMWVGVSFYEVPITTSDIDVAVYFDEESSDRIEEFINMLVEEYEIKITPWKLLSYLQIKGFVHLVPKSENALFRIDVLAVDKQTRFYDVWLDALNNKLKVKWEDRTIHIPTLEYWIALKLISFRNKDKLQLLTMLSYYHYFGRRINIKKLQEIIGKHRILVDRWNEVLDILRDDYLLCINEKGEILQCKE